MARRGLNCTLTYNDGQAVRSYRVRCDMATHGVVMVSEESSGRTRRAYFPHRIAEDQFAINVILIGNAERRDFVSWLEGYVSLMLSLDTPLSNFPPMRVSIPARRFHRVGIPLSGIEKGDHVGSMVWNHLMQFEAVPDTLSRKEVSRPVTTVSRTSLETEFFYPFANQLSGDQAPLVYTRVIDATYSGSTATIQVDENGIPIERDPVGGSIFGEADVT